MPNTISPNMGLIVPGVGTEPGPAWANDLNSDLGILDQHNHSAGQGVPITPSGLNINSDLSLQDNNLVNVSTVNFTAHSLPLAGSPPNLGCIYVSGRELYYNDEVGNVVPITNNGNVNAGAGSITGLPSGTASASYSSGTQTFVWQSATSTPANMDFGSAIFRNIIANSKGLTLNPPNAMAADYSVTLPPSNPVGSTAFLTYDTSNNIAAGPSIVGGITLSMLATALIQYLTPSGEINMYGGVTAPTGWILCDGSAVSRTTFSDLFTAIGTNYGNGDGSTTFNVPDLRGLFPRGTDSGAGNDPDSVSRTAQSPGGNTGDNVGSVQSDEFASHFHSFVAQVFSNVGGPGAQSGPSFGLRNQTANAGGNETRPKNVYVNFIIKT